MIKKIIVIILIILMCSQLFAVESKNCCDTKCCRYTRTVPDKYASYKDHTKMCFTEGCECPPSNDSITKGYLYKGNFWDTAGVRYWAFRNATNNTITIQAIDGGEQKDIPAGDVVNIKRGQSYGFRVQAPARLFELFNSDEHNIEIFINAQGYIDYRAEQPLKRARVTTQDMHHPRL